MTHLTLSPRITALLSITPGNVFKGGTWCVKQIICVLRFFFARYRGQLHVFIGTLFYSLPRKFTADQYEFIDHKLSSFHGLFLRYRDS
jgi:hypothetical protein